jgi:transposase
MSLQPVAEYRVPDDTARVANAIFPKGNIYIILASELKTFLKDEDLAELFPNKGQPAESPLRLALATILQYLERLTDRQTADAIRTRIDWKYLLCLELTDSGFHHTVLSEFRTRLITGEAEALILEKLLQLCQEKGWLKSRMRQRTDSTHVLSAIRAVTRLECVGETLRAALNTLSLVAPDWLLSNTDEEWVERYNTRIEDYHQPKSKNKREELANIYGEDGLQLLNAIFEIESPDWLRKIPAVEMLRRVWVQQYYLNNDDIRWRTAQEIPPASVMISSPYDRDARYAKKHTTTWVGYKVHLTETCESNQPHLITHVETTPAPITDDQATQPIHESLKSKDLLPSQHIVDTGYLDAELLATTKQQYSVELIGPTRNDYHWQSKEGKVFE